MGLATAVAAIAVGGQLVAGSKAKKASKRANRAQREINRLKNEQARRAYMRSFRQAQAAALVGGIASGAGLESSLVQGTLTSQHSQTITAQSEFNKTNELGDVYAAALNKQASANFMGSVFGSVASFATSAAGSDFLNKAGTKIGIGP